MIDQYKLIFHSSFIQLELENEAHYTIENFKDCLDFKESIYGAKKVGILVNRLRPEDSYSFDPMLLLEDSRAIERHTKWVIVVSPVTEISENLEFIKQMTNIPCYLFKEYEEALNAINSDNLPGQ